MSCPSTNSNITDTSEDVFFSPDGIHWDAHRIGWAVAGGCAALTTLITLFNLTMHAIRYQHPPAQRQVMRVLLMPAVYSIVSFFSYRYYREYEYYILAETAYEAITLSAFLMLLMELVTMGTTDQDIKTALAEKDKKKFPFPFNFWRFRASKPYFWHALSFSVMQYVILRPLISVIGIICLYYGVLCPDEYSIHYAEVYLDAVDFVSISIALYGLIIFYVLCKGELKGRKPLSKFLAIKLIVFFTFYQSFLFSILQSHGVIKGTALWTATNVSDGLSALCTCVEMVFFSIYMGWAYNWTDYTDPLKNPYQRKTGFKTYCQAIWDTINLLDFCVEIYLACKFFVDFIRGKPGTHSSTKIQRTFMPGMVDENDGDRPQELSNLKTGHAAFSNGTQNGGSGIGHGIGQDNFTSPPKPIRSTSGSFSHSLRSPDSYQRLQEGQSTSTNTNMVVNTNRRKGSTGPGQPDGNYQYNSQDGSYSSPLRSSGIESYQTANTRSPGTGNGNQGNIASPHSYQSNTTSEYGTPRGGESFPQAQPTGSRTNSSSGQMTQWPTPNSHTVPASTYGVNELGQTQNNGLNTRSQNGWSDHALSQSRRGYGQSHNQIRREDQDAEQEQQQHQQQGIPGNPRLY
ncbi:uncharacterized protein IL334_002962 [Kwoniella shivajii]|uniref:DUF300-domain-containing protein n=1 Tax=Kwoniella shivajii TaxID=564305 RepID=A0ABZ1CW62_9TREE|nr:hypothetical protein IL334_002962 [Kwoniella shivajii]